MSVIRKDLGIATAYGYAVSKGYIGTEEEFAELMASYATVAEEAQEAAEQATQAVQTAQAAVNTATTKAGEAATSASGAATSASQAGQSATAAAGLASTASAKAAEAGTSATNAAASETVATQSAQTAATKAGEASASATAASQSATAAAGSASDASDDADRAETAAGSVSAAAEQIATNTADIANLKDDLSEIENGVSGLIGGQDITSLYQNGYIATNQATVNLDNTHPTDKNHKCVVLECNEGEEYVIKGYSGGSTIYAVWCWVASDRTTKISASGIKNIEKDIVITAPEGAAYLVSNVLVGSDYSLVKGVKIINNVNNVELALQSLNLFADTDAIPGYLSSTGDIVSGSNGEKTSDYISVKEGDLLNIQIWADPGTSYSWMGLGTYDTEKTFLTRTVQQSSNGESYLKYLYIVPAGVSYIRFSARFYSDGIAMVTRGDFDIGYVPSYKDIEMKEGSDEDVASNILSNIGTITGNTIYTDNYSFGYIATNTTTINPENVRPSASYKCIVLPCVAGDVFSIKGHSGPSTIYNLYTFISSDGTKLKGVGMVAYDDYYAIEAPENTAYLVSNVDVNYEYGLISNRLLTDKVEELTVQSKANAGLYSTLLRPAGPRFAMHRGMSLSAPENTIPSFTLAGQAGAWAIETDVYETTDGYFVLSHDNDVSRTTDGTGNITDMTYAQTQECTIDVGANIEQYPNLKIPLLSEYLKICRKYGCVAFVEIKGITHYDALIAEIKKCGMEGSTALLCYYNEIVISLLRELTAMPIVLIGAATADLSDLTHKASKYADVWLTTYNTITTEEVINNAHLANVPIGVWTVDNVASAETYFSRGADYITSDSLAKLP